MAKKDVMSMDPSELYDHIRSEYESKEDFILSEMLRLGFWKKEEDSESDKRQKELNELLTQLTNELDALNNQASAKSINKILKERRLERMALSRERQQEKREE